MEHKTHTLEAALRGLDYPAPRNKLLATALQNGAAPELIDRIRQLPETADFLGPEDLYEALGVHVRGETPSGWQ